MKTKKLSYTALFIALATVTSPFVSIPIGFARIFPVQHFVNVLSAVLLGPGYAVMQALGTSILRNLFGTGTIFAFPGSVVGALCAGVMYRYTKKLALTSAGEMIGTGIIGALLTYPLALLLLGETTALFAFVPSFLLSAIAGGLLAYGLLKTFEQRGILERFRS
ncbi:energy coupling factor transporter S component ThiW [Alteribacillus persepolensis]|uniref:Energy coupling factor transporter S component ThiW n=1 Tax=Alteribacillus persepolensis TaxID=568899 RepID=A0A1G8FLW6_9BACI|nr:energy coupling factor transporter S component ThiW [Alteribacillus persepolensis]SDH83154.1 energy coupling factor transporter S component ThiW [Alteribacillus persepolensis]